MAWVLVGQSFLRAGGLITKNTRRLSIHEYVCASFLRDSGVSVPKGGVASTADEAFSVANTLRSDDYVVKAQVLAGGRGKGLLKKAQIGGVQVAYSPNEVRELASKMIGDYLVTRQTGKEGLPCNKVYICERLYPRREYYIAFTLDRETKGPLLIGSNRGGVNIEDVAKETPDAIVTQRIDINQGLTPEVAVEFIKKIKFTESCTVVGAEELVKLYKLFISKDCTLMEINPFCETNTGEVVCMDSKIQLDDNALFRHPDFSDFRDYSQENKLDVLAAKNNLNYIGLDGTIGCLVNGAGLAMATMDIIRLHGGTPANFLDIGGGASSSQVMAAFNIIKSDPNVRAVLVNIFGGIMRCDVIAEGIIEAAKNIELKIPLVIRLQGTKVEEAQALLANSQMKILPVSDFDQAAKMAVKLANIVQLAKEVAVDVKFELPI